MQTEQTLPSMKEREELIHYLLDLGELLLGCGAEVNRVEDTMNRIGHRYGAHRMNVFATPSSIVVTMIYPDHSEVTRTRRIEPSVGNPDYGTFEELNQLSRDCCAEGSDMSIGEFGRRFEKIRAAKRPVYRSYLGAALAAGSFAVFFGGTVLDGIAAALFGLLVVRLTSSLGQISPNYVAFNLLSSLILGILIGLASHLVPFLHMDKIMIGDIMLLIPGVAMTNSLRDVLIGDTYTGVFRFIESLIWALALACGFMLAIWLTDLIG